MEKLYAVPVCVRVHLCERPTAIRLRMTAVAMYTTTITPLKRRNTEMNQ